MLIDFEYCNKLINALITIKNNCTKEKAVQISTGYYTIQLGCDPETDWLDFDFKYNGTSDIISIDIHKTTKDTSEDGIIKMFKRTPDGMDTRYKTFITARDSEIKRFAFLGYDSSIQHYDTTLSVDFDDEEYFQYSTVNVVPAKEELIQYRDLYYKIKNEVNSNTACRLSYLNVNADQPDLDELLCTLYALVPVFSK